MCCGRRGGEFYHGRSLGGGTSVELALVVLLRSFSIKGNTEIPCGIKQVKQKSYLENNSNHFVWPRPSTTQANRLFSQVTRRLSGVL